MTKSWTEQHPGLVRCEQIVTTRNRYKLPPNTSQQQCRHQAAGRRGGQALCQMHINMFDRHKAHGLQRYEARLKQDAYLKSLGLTRADVARRDLERRRQARQDRRK